MTLEDFRKTLSASAKTLEPDQLSWLSERRIEPKAATLHWEFGSDEPFPAWIFAHTGRGDVVFAYCEGGHGALGCPWGMIFESNSGFGMDCCWHPKLGSLINEELAPPGIGGDA